MNGTQSTVAVIIPSYKRPDLLQRAIESVLAQTLADYDLIVVDDGADPATQSLVASYKRVRYFSQARQGPAAARNAGLAVSRSQYIASLDHDDEWDPQFLQRAVCVLDGERMDAVWLNFRERGSHGTDNALLGIKNKLHFDRSEGNSLLTRAQALSFFLHEPGPMSNSALVIRREALGSGWHPDAEVADDWLLMARLLTNPNLKCAISTDASWTKHVHGANHSNWSPETGMRCIRDFTYACENFMQAYPPENQRKLRRQLGNLHYKLAYHLLWQRNPRGAWREIQSGRCSTGVTAEFFRLIVLCIMRKAARVMGIPPLGRW